MGSLEFAPAAFFGLWGLARNIVFVMKRNRVRAVQCRGRSHYSDRHSIGQPIPMQDISRGPGG